MKGRDDKGCIVPFGVVSTADRIDVGSSWGGGFIISPLVLNHETIGKHYAASREPGAITDDAVMVGPDEKHEVRYNKNTHHFRFDKTTETETEVTIVIEPKPKAKAAS